MADLRGKNILLIVPKFFGYDIVIANRLKNLGACVYMLYEDMNEVNYYYRFINAYLPHYMSELMDDYFFKHILPIADKLDYVFLIRGEFLSRTVMDRLKKTTKSGCRYCMYQWDSFKNNNNALQIADYFDFKATFDPEDALTSGWYYRPLFYIPELITDEKQDIDVLYMCSLHSNRIEVLNRLKVLCAEKKLKIYKRVYSKKLIFYKRKYLNRREGYIKADNGDISSKKMDVTDTYAVYNRSRIVVDYTHPGQNGFTMRTIEALGCKKKLITNNAKIREADFFDENNIYVYEGEDIDIPDSFIQSDYRDIDDDIYKKYSIDMWLSSILGQGA